MPFIHSRPRYFAEVLANLLWWVGADKLLFASDYAIWHPRWIVEKFMAFELPDDIQKEFGVSFTLDVKKKILGENAEDLLRSEEHTSELQSLTNLVCRLLLEKKKKKQRPRDCDMTIDTVTREQLA